MSFIDDIKGQAKSDKKRIVLPEYMDSRTYEAAVKIAQEGIADIVLIGTPEEIAANKGDYDLTGITVIDPTTDPNRQKYID